MTNRTNPMTTADAKVELVKRAIESAFIAKHKTAIGPSYAETAARAAITALEASPNSRTEAITDEMVNAGARALGEHSFAHLTDVEFRIVYTAMQAARPIDQQEAMDAGYMRVPTYAKCDTYVAGQYAFNYLRTFLAEAGIDASLCKLVIELPDRDTQRQLVSAVQRDSKGPPRSAGKIGNHSGIWQGVEYEFSVKGWNAKSRAFGYEVHDGATSAETPIPGPIAPAQDDEPEQASS